MVAKCRWWGDSEIDGDLDEARIPHPTISADKQVTVCVRYDCTRVTWRESWKKLWKGALVEASLRRIEVSV